MSGPAIPSVGRSCDCWKRRTASVVKGPPAVDPPRIEPEPEQLILEFSDSFVLRQGVHRRRRATAAQRGCSGRVLALHADDDGGAGVAPGASRGARFRLPPVTAWRSTGSASGPDCGASVHSSGLGRERQPEGSGPLNSACASGPSLAVTRSPDAAATCADHQGPARSVDWRCRWAPVGERAGSA